MDNQERNREALIDHIAEQDRIIRRRNEQIAALQADGCRLRRELLERPLSPSEELIERAETAEADLAELQAMHSQQIETIARLQKNPRPLTADDGMLSRAVLEARKHRGTCDAFHSEVQAIVNAALTEPKPRLEGAEDWEAALDDFWSRGGDADDLADWLAFMGVRVTGGRS